MKFLLRDVLLEQACRNAARRVFVTIKFCSVVSRIYGSSELNLLLITLLEPEFGGVPRFLKTFVHPCTFIKCMQVSIKVLFIENVARNAVE